MAEPRDGHARLVIPGSGPAITRAGSACMAALDARRWPDTL